jgi:phospholipid/cholesterol/gamma-HCH transport system ATP-binding protein
MQFFKLFLILLFSCYLLLLISLLARRFHKRVMTEATRPKSPTPCGKDSEAIIEIIGVKKSFDQPVLQDITLPVYCGETVGILGKSGTGKSVLLKLIAGFLRPDSGAILFRGEDITSMDEQDLLEFRKRVSYVFQGGAFFDFLNVRENVAYPLRERQTLNDVQISTRVEYLLDAVELEGMGDLRYDELSAGAKKQVAIARSIAINPAVILYDEPTTGVDPIIGKSLSRLIRKLGRQENLTSIVVTHDLKCLEIVSDRIVLLKDGSIKFQGTVDEFLSSLDPFVEAFRSGKRFEEDKPVPGHGGVGGFEIRDSKFEI